MCGALSGISRPADPAELEAEKHGGRLVVVLPVCVYRQFDVRDEYFRVLARVPNTEGMSARGSGGDLWEVYPRECELVGWEFGDIAIGSRNFRAVLHV